MARIRSIKPEFPHSESLGRISRDARLCFVLMWTQADDSGRLRGSSRMLASLLFPYDDDAPSLMDIWMGELERVGCIRRYLVDDKHYVDIPKWLEHQKIDRPSASRFPAFDETSRALVEPSSSDQGPGSKDQGGEGSTPAAPAAAQVEIESPKTRKPRGTALPPDWELPADWKAMADEVRLRHVLPAVELGLEAEKFRAYAIGQGWQRPNWREAWLKWALDALPPKSNGAKAMPAFSTTNGGSQPQPMSWEQRLKNHKPGGYWPQTWGPAPERDEHHDCPSHLVAQWRTANGVAA